MTSAAVWYIVWNETRGVLGEVDDGPCKTKRGNKGSLDQSGDEKHGIGTEVRNPIFQK